MLLGSGKDRVAVKSWAPWPDGTIVSLENPGHRGTGDFYTV